MHIMRKLFLAGVVAGASALPLALAGPAGANPPSNRPPAHCGGRGQHECPPPAPPGVLGLIVNSQGVCILP
jgi:Spy/CpxP family protein refolding chaperone